MTVIDFDSLMGPIGSTTYLASDGVLIDGSDAREALPEGDASPVGTIDGYDGTDQPDTNPVMVTTCGMGCDEEDNRLTFVFDPPVSSVGAFLAGRLDPAAADDELGGYEVRVYDATGDLVDVSDVALRRFDDATNGEAFASFPNDSSTSSALISRMTILRVKSSCRFTDNRICSRAAAGLPVGPPC